MPILLVVNVQLGLIFWLIKFSLQTLQINKIYALLGQTNQSITKHILYEFYMFLITIGTTIFFLLPAKTIWKERKY
jgi:hypothetical protein